MMHIKEFFEKYEIDDILINVIINIGLISTFISIFFFTYVSDVEKIIIKKQGNIITEDLISTIKPFLSEEDRNKIKNNLTTPDMSHEDDMNTQRNDALKNSAYSNIIFIFGICMLLSLILSIIFIKPTHNYITVLLVNFILLVIVGLTELTFLNFILSNYIIGDPNYVKYKLITAIRNKFIFPNIAPS
jgi:hypothetical protein